MSLSLLNWERLLKLLYLGAVLFLTSLAGFLILRLLSLPLALQAFVTPLLWLLLMTLAALLGVLLYRWHRPKIKITSGTLGRKGIKVTDIAFIGLLTAAFLVASYSLYYPPLVFYILIAAAAAALGTKILLARPSRLRIGWPLLQIILLGLLLRAIPFFVNSFPPGSDSFVHLAIVQNTLATGHVGPIAGPYEFYPLYHIYIALTALVGGDLILGAAVITIAVQTVGILAVFLIGNRLGGPKPGLLAAYLLSFSVLSLGAAIGLQPMAQGVTYLLVALAGFLSYRKTRDALLFWLPALALFFIHPFPAFVLVLTLAGMWGVNRARALLPLRQYRPLHFASLSYGLAFTSYLVLVNTVLLTNLIEWVFVPELSTPVFGASLHPAEVNVLFVVQALFQYLGVAAILTLAAYGLLRWIQGRDFNKTLFVVLILLMVSVPLTNVLTGDYWAGGMIVGRAPPFVWALLVLPAGATLATVRFRRGMRKWLPVVVALFFAFVFVSTSSYQSGAVGLPTVSEIPITPEFVTGSAIAGQIFISKGATGTAVITDQWTAYYVMSSRGLLDLPAHNVSTLTLDQVRPGFYVLNWIYLGIGSETIEGRTVKITPEYLQLFVGHPRVMDSGALVVIYVSES